MASCCRTCLRDKRPNSMKLLSTKWNDTLLSFADMLMDIVILNKEITTDKTSFRICSSCELDLITAYNFKIVCQNTEKILAERLTKTINEMLPPIDIEEIKCETIIDDFSDNFEETSKNLIEKCKEQPDQTSDVEIKPKVKSTFKKTLNKSFKKKTTKLNINIKNNENKEENVNSLDTIKFENQSAIAEKPVNVRKCRECNLSFEEQKFYRRHRRDVHKYSPSKRKESRNKNRKPSVFCRKCDVTFETEKLYRKHCEETHLQSLPCTICGKLYLETRMKRHMTTHSTERAHLCIICGRNFVSKSYLDEHLRIHADDKRYKCNYCDETFVHWNSRKFHIINVHTKEKEYECYICHKLFARSGQMSLHIKCHLGDLRHPCTLCDKRFVHEYALSRHKLTHFNKRKKRMSKKNITENSTNVNEPLVGVYS